jgi:hypothetical protein
MELTSSIHDYVFIDATSTTENIMLTMVLLVGGAKGS